MKHFVIGLGTPNLGTTTAGSGARVNGATRTGRRLVLVTEFALDERGESATLLDSVALNSKKNGRRDR